jgi:hypothetical protein
MTFNCHISLLKTWMAYSWNIIKVVYNVKFVLPKIGNLDFGIIL